MRDNPPRKPFEPYLPQKMIQQAVRHSINSTSWSVPELLTAINEAVAKAALDGVSPEGVEIWIDDDDYEDTATLECRWFVDLPNPYYEERLARYQEAMLDYERRLIEYEEQLAAWNKQNKTEERARLLNAIDDLKAKLEAL